MLYRTIQAAFLAQHFGPQAMTAGGSVYEGELVEVALGAARYFAAGQPQQMTVAFKPDGEIDWEKALTASTRP
jgi:hypothetical protein